MRPPSPPPPRWNRPCATVGRSCAAEGLWTKAPAIRLTSVNHVFAVTQQLLYPARGGLHRIVPAGEQGGHLGEIRAHTCSRGIIVQQPNRLCRDPFAGHFSLNQLRRNLTPGHQVDHREERRLHQPPSQYPT